MKQGRGARSKELKFVHSTKATVPAVALMLRRCALGFTLFARTRAALSSQLMRIFSWARLAPSLSPISGRSAVTTMAAQAPEWAGLLKEG